MRRASLIRRGSSVSEVLWATDALGDPLDAPDIHLSEGPAATGLFNWGHGRRSGDLRGSRV